MSMLTIQNSTNIRASVEQRQLEAKYSHLPQPSQRIDKVRSQLRQTEQAHLTGSLPITEMLKKHSQDPYIELQGLSGVFPDKLTLPKGLSLLRRIKSHLGPMDRILDRRLTQMLTSFPTKSMSSRNAKHLF